MKVLFTGCTFNEEKLEELKNVGIEVSTGRMDYSEDELTNILKDCNCYINGGDEICTRRVIENNKHLKLISFMGTGYQKYIDVDAAKEYGIPVSYTPSANAKAVAEYTVALILDAVKKITFSNNEIRNKEWNKYKTFNLEGKTLGIVGMGTIGSYIAKILCDGFGMKLIYNSRESKPDIDSRSNTSMVSLNDVFNKADIISVNATYTLDNSNMISKEQFDLAKEGLVFVNTARPELVNKDDLYNAITNNKIGFVAMDGFYTEPMDYDDEFLKLPCDKFVITPHKTYHSKDAVIEMERMLIESLTDVKNENEIRNTVK